MGRLAPIDIFNKEFKEVLRGYSKPEVDEFLDLVIKNYEDVLHENEQYREDIVQLKRELKKLQKGADPSVSNAPAGTSVELPRPLVQAGVEGGTNGLADMDQQHSSHRSGDSMARVLGKLDQVTQRLEDLEENFDQLRQQSLRR
ncbi:DivIVA domain-containing protein [Pasteuria penetrans]|uniref:DivIVA domain-containing protein n=1 Tax=Pasteuria penetrans TaxID=86005 RepID=UPI000FB8CC44|nr:DivIVA domain-containing protein [Pasteuria penetrans]